MTSGVVESLVTIDEKQLPFMGIDNLIVNLRAIGRLGR